MENNCNNSGIVYLAYHKSSIIIQNNIFTPIHSGKKISSLELSIMGDDTGDNISIFGDTLNELTVLYWMWKNDTKHTYLGLCHYRRIFIFNDDLIKKIGKPEKIVPFLPENYEEKFGWRLTDLNNVISDADIIVPRYRNSPFGRTQKEQYIKKHGIESFEALVNGVKNYAPDYYSYLMEYFNGKRLTIGNMLLMRRDLLNDYCNWMFPLLKHVNPEIDPIKLTPYKRRQGFAAERLLHIYIEKMKVDHPEIVIRRYPLLYIYETSPDVHSNKAFIERTIKNFFRK